MYILYTFNLIYLKIQTMKDEINNIKTKSTIICVYTMTMFCVHTDWSTF